MDMMITRGTTPTITFTYKTVPVDEIVDAYLTITQRGEEIIERDIATATKGEDTLSWTLTQDETLLFCPCGTILMQCTYKTNDGTRGSSKVFEVEGGVSLKDGVI